MVSFSFFSDGYVTLHLPFCNFQGSVVTCNTCHGSGMYIRIHQIGPGMVQQIHTQCRDCGGSGERIPGNITFSGCSSRGMAEVVQFCFWCKLYL